MTVCVSLSYIYSVTYIAIVKLKVISVETVVLLLLKYTKTLKRARYKIEPSLYSAFDTFDSW